MILLVRRLQVALHRLEGRARLGGSRGGACCCGRSLRWCVCGLWAGQERVLKKGGNKRIQQGSEYNRTSRRKQSVSGKSFSRDIIYNYKEYLHKTMYRTCIFLISLNMNECCLKLAVYCGFWHLFQWFSEENYPSETWQTSDCEKKNSNYAVCSWVIQVRCSPRWNTSLWGSPADLTGEASGVGSAWWEGAGWGQGSVSGLDFGIGRYHTLHLNF